MNSKLEVVRIDEDIIATSGVCKDLEYTHIYVSSYNPSGVDTYYVYWYDQDLDKLVFDENVNDVDLSATVNAVNSKGWYAITPDQEYIKCEEQHDDSHPWIEIPG